MSVIAERLKDSANDISRLRQKKHQADGLLCNARRSQDAYRKRETRKRLWRTARKPLGP